MGTMNVFAVVFTGGEGESEAFERALNAEFPHAYRLTGSAFLVRSDRLSSQIAESIHIKGESRQFTGVVFKINHSYSGFTSRDLWEWLDGAAAE